MRLPVSYADHMRLMHCSNIHRFQVQWSETTGSGNNQQTTVDYYRNERVYFSHKMVIWGNPLSSSADAPTMPAGTHSIPFQFLLPREIPPSYEGSAPFDSFEAYVRYTCKATIGESGY